MYFLHHFTEFSYLDLFNGRFLPRARGLNIVFLDCLELKWCISFEIIGRRVFIHLLVDASKTSLPLEQITSHFKHF